jgi:hypothetical protein
VLPEAIINRPLVGTYSGEQHAQQDRPAFRIIVAEWAHNKREVVRVEITVHRGRPTVVKSSGVAAATSIVDAAKSHTTLQAWALALKDTLERAWTFTELWLNETRPTGVNVNVDFDVSAESVKEAGVILDAEKNAVISKQTTRGELQRRSWTAGRLGK